MILSLQEKLFKLFNVEINVFSEKQEYFFRQFSKRLFIYFYILVLTLSLIGVTINLLNKKAQKAVSSRSEAVKQNVSWITSAPFLLIIIPIVYIFTIKQTKKKTKDKFK